MNKRQVNEILINQTKRRNTILGFICIISIMLIISTSFFLIYVSRNKTYYVSYSEKSNIDYKVFLKENDFFDKDYLEANKQYIARLVDYINADFEYKLSLDEKEVEYKYLYRIEADVSVKQKQTNNLLFNKIVPILKNEEIVSNSTDVVIRENVNIDYNYYNDLISRFVNTYGLDEFESTLTINMYVNVIGSCEDFVRSEENESVISLSIPLTTKTVAIDLGNKLVNSQNNVMQCRNVYSYNFIFLIIGSFFLLIDIIIIIRLIQYIIKTRTAESIYERELKKIIYNYGSYIQKLSNDFDFDFQGCQLLKIDTFTDMLEIRDTIRQPILFKENLEKTGAYFLIPSDTKILYVYRLRIIDIKKNMNIKEEA